MVKYKIAYTKHHEFGINYHKSFFKTIEEAEEYRNILLQDPEVHIVDIILER